MITLVVFNKLHFEIKPLWRSMKRLCTLIVSDSSKGFNQRPHVTAVSLVLWKQIVYAEHCIHWMDYKV